MFMYDCVSLCVSVCVCAVHVGLRDVSFEEQFQGLKPLNPSEHPFCLHPTPHQKKKEIE